MLNTKCPKCGGLFDSATTKIKRVDDIGCCADTLIFDCPCCGEEIAEINCDRVETDICQMCFETKAMEGYTVCKECYEALNE